MILVSEYLRDYESHSLSKWWFIWPYPQASMSFELCRDGIIAVSALQVL